MKKWIPVLIFLFLFWLLFLFRKETIIVDEEATPFREKEKITGLFYDVSISKSRHSSLVVPLSLLESISHYKDISQIDSFFVEMNIDYPSSYEIQDIVYMDLNHHKKEIAYEVKNQKILLSFSKSFFEEIHKEDTIHLFLSL